ncbi:MAG: 5-formyltetrahydrofolate cyclo-ligase [Paracoccaceae bacterium]
MTLAEIKRGARAEAFARRKAAFAGRTGTDAHLLREVLAAHPREVLAGYMPMRTEIDCLPAMAAHDGPVGVPVILGAGQALRFRTWTPHAPMVAGEFGAFVPEKGDWLKPGLLVVPLLAFDRRGFRLGYGGGFYDRTLEGLRKGAAITAIGFAFAAQEVDAVPVEPTDQPLDLIVTEREVIVPER